MANSNIAYYVDMDGVLARWNSKASIEETHEKGYFLWREPEPVMTDVLQEMVAHGLDVSILSHVYTGGMETAMRDKCQWLCNAGLGSINRIFVPYGMNKEDFIRKGPTLNVLIDDFSRNLHKWEKAGHLGFKFYNGINGTKGTWHGYSVDYRMPAEAVFTEITAVSNAILSGMQKEAV